MYPLRNLTAAERNLFHRALRGASDDVASDPDAPGDSENEAPDIDPEPTDPPATTPDPDPGANPMRVVVANVQAQMSVARKREDYNKLAAMGSVLLLQEVYTAGARAAASNSLPDSQWHHVPSMDVARGERVALKKAQWDVQQGGVYFASPKPRSGGRGRYLATALATLKGTSIQVLFVSTHYVAHAWCNHNISNRPQRRRYWNKHDDRFRSLVLDARSKGITVVGGGDYNRSQSQGRNAFHANQVWLRQSWLDGLFGLEAAGGASFTVGGTQRVNMNSDHDALVAQLTWTAGADPVKSGYNWPGL